MEKKQWKPLVLNLCPSIHRKIEHDISLQEEWSVTKTQWIREAIAQKLGKRKTHDPI